MTEYIKILNSKSAGEKVISLGKQHENGATEIVFDISEWEKEYGGDGFMSLYVKRNGDSSAYPVLLETDGSLAHWTVSATDTEASGEGSAELDYRIGETVVRSATFKTVVFQSVSEPSCDPPDAYETWVDTLVSLGDDTREYAVDALAAQIGAETAEEGAESAKTAAEAAQLGAESAEADAESAKTAAEAAKTGAENAKSAAETAKNGAVNARTAAERARTGAEAARDGAETAESGALRARSLAETAQSRAETAKAGAESAKTAASNYAAHYPYIGTTNRHWYVWSENDGGFVDTGIVAEGQDGSDADVTAQNIAAALGYTPADETDVAAIAADYLKSDDLDGYVKNTDYASSSQAGVVKTNAAYGLAMASSGELYAATKTLSQYSSGSDSLIIGKGTLENVLDGKNLNGVLDETWTFTLDDDTTVTKTVKVGT